MTPIIRKTAVLLSALLLLALLLPACTPGDGGDTPTESLPAETVVTEPPTEPATEPETEAPTDTPTEAPDAETGTEPAGTEPSADKGCASAVGCAALLCTMAAAFVLAVRKKH